MRIVSKLFPASLIVVACLGLATPSAFADLIFTTSIEVSGTGLGNVNTIVTVSDTGSGNDIESGCINSDSSLTPCLGGVEGGDNLAINQVLTFDTNQSFAAVVNLAETGQDLSVTLTHLYLGFTGTSSSFVAFYTGSSIVLTSGTGTGLGNSGFVFALDAAQFASVQALGASVDVWGGVQFAEGTTNNGPETVHVIRANPIPEPSTVLFLGSGLVGLALVSWRRRRAS